MVPDIRKKAPYVLLTILLFCLIPGTVTAIESETATTYTYSGPTTTYSGGNQGGGGGGGGGGGAVSNEEYTNIEIKEKYDLHIYKDKITSYTFSNRSNPLLFINITGNVNAGEINTAVEVLRNTSALVKNPAPGIVYKNVNIWVGTSGFAIPKNIKEAVIRFRIENSWIRSNNLAAGNIGMLRWDGSQWVQIKTAEKTKDSAYTYFESETDSFSSFAISGLESKGGVTEAGAALPVTWSSKPTGTTGSPEATLTEKAAATEKASGFGLFLAVATLGAFYMFRRKRE